MSVKMSEMVILIMGNILSRLGVATFPGEHSLFSSITVMRQDHKLGQGEDDDYT